MHNIIANRRQLEDRRVAEFLVEIDRRQGARRFEDQAPTPGPWFNTSQDDTPLGEVMDQPLDSGVTLHISVSGPNAKADARLIAAAPDLLEALRGLWDHHDSDDYQKRIAACANARGAIAKATR